MLMLSPAVALCHGMVGDRIFLSPIIGNDAFPDNAIGVATRRSDFEFSLLPALEKQLTDNSSLLISGGWDEIESRAQPETSGATDLSIYFRQAAYISVPHELEITLSPFIIVPTGNRRIADQGFTHLGGDFLLGKGMGDLPDRGLLKFLRPFAVQAEAGYAGRIEGPANSDVFANLEVEYSLRYFSRFVRRREVRGPWFELVPYTEFNYSQALIASRLNTLPDFRLTPGLAYMGDWCEVSIGAQVALNAAAQKGDRVAVVGLVEVFYDDIVPALGWTPF